MKAESFSLILDKIFQVFPFPSGIYLGRNIIHRNLTFGDVYMDTL
jgi:hypothetical protein